MIITSIRKAWYKGGVLYHGSEKYEKYWKKCIEKYFTSPNLVRWRFIEENKQNSKVHWTTGKVKKIRKELHWVLESARCDKAFSKSVVAFRSEIKKLKSY